MNDTISAACLPLIEKLKCYDPIERERARQELIRLGPGATESIVGLLQSPIQHVRWEAAKALAGIADPRAALALIDAMDDRDTDVRWVAAAAMVALRQRAITPLMSALIRRAESIQFCQSAHHVLSSLIQQVVEPDLVAGAQSLGARRTGHYGTARRSLRLGAICVWCTTAVTLRYEGSPCLTFLSICSACWKSTGPIKRLFRDS